MAEDAGVCEVCGSAASRRCSACRLAAYCGRQHQKEHWPSHKNACRPFEMNQSQSLGRYLTAIRDLEPGAVILSEPPLVAGPRLRDPAALCPGCLRVPDSSGLARCPKCFLALCGMSCPGLKSHQPECAVLQIDPSPLAPPYALLTPLRCMLLQRRHPDRWQQLMAMENHDDKRGPGSDAYRELEDLVVQPLVRRFLSRLPDDTLPDRSPEAVRRVCGALDVNAMEVRSMGAGGGAIALFPVACLLEHSCLPNTRHGFYADPGSPRNMKITVRAATPIARGQHVTTMYTHALWGTHARRSHLRETKYFTCTCKRCSDPTEMKTYLSGLRCLGVESDGSCGGIQLPHEPLKDDTEWRCDRCPVAVPGGQVEDLISRIGDEVDTIQTESPTLPRLEALLHKLLKLLHPHHFHVVAVMHSLLQLMPQDMSEEKLHWKAEHCRDLLEVCRALDPGWARLSLYAAVLQVELQKALRALAARVGTTEAKTKAALEARSLLGSAEAALQPEPEGSPGARYADVVRNEMRALEKEMIASTN